MKNLTLAIKAALLAGKEILEVYNDPNSDFAVEKKADNSPLTIADKKAHIVISKHLETSSLPILSEEGDHADYSQRKDHAQMWIVDPLDGTKEFIKKNGEFTVNIALVEGGEPTLGVIYVPVKRVLYFAEKKIGSYKVENIDFESDLFDKNDYLSLSTKLPLINKKEKYTVVASRSHLSPETEAFIDELKKEHGEIECLSSGSSIKLVLVAEGSADVYPRFAPTMEWDTAAGDAIARCAGKTVVDSRDNTPLRYNKENLLNPWFIVR